MHQFLLRRLLTFGGLDEAEIAALTALGESLQRFAPGQVIHAVGDPSDACYLLVDGWVVSSVPVADKLRQIVKLHLPGDMLGTSCMALTHTAETLVTVTIATVKRVALADFADLCRQHPRVAMMMLFVVQQERVLLMDPLASLGRTSGVQRLAALLLHIYDRLRINVPEHPLEFRLPLTQIHIADIIGLTPVHVNRMFHDLEQSGLIARIKRVIRIVSLDDLRAFAALPRRNWVYEPDWLPSCTP